MVDLEDFISSQLRAPEDSSTDAQSTLTPDRRPFVIKNFRVYRHATARFNFTTYDIQRDQDLIHCSPNLDEPRDKIAVLVHSPSSTRSCPWAYAIVLGIYHTVIVLPDLTERSIEFLWVRWLEDDPTWVSGPATRTLERVRFASESPVGFVDPQTVIRGCHLIPAFAHGRVVNNWTDSVACFPGGDWSYFYVNRYGAHFNRVSVWY